MRRPIWTCTIGIQGQINTPSGCDSPMRQAAAKAYKEITGVEPEFIFSGWNGRLTEAQQAVVNNTE